MSLRQAHELAVESNVSLEVAKLDPLLAEADYLAQQGVFDPNISVNFVFSDRTDPLNTGTIISIGGVVTAIDAETFVMVGAIGGVTTAGTQYSLTLQRSRDISTINAAFGANGQNDVDITATLTQPLLKNFGIGVNTTGLRVADLERTASHLRLEESLISTLFNVEQSYWNLVLAQDQLGVQASGVALAEQLLDETETRLEVGVVAPLDVLEAETAVARREEDVLLAAQSMDDSSDALQRLVFPSWESFLSASRILPVDSPDAPLPELDMDACTQTALQNRTELKQARVAVKQARISTAFQENQLLPEVNFVGSYGYRGIGLNFAQARDQIYGGQTKHWMAGVEVTVPFGNREARGAHRRAVATQRQAELAVRLAEIGIIQDVRSAVRAVESGSQRVTATATARRLAEEQLKAEESKLEVGVSTPFDVREKQDDLIEAQNNALQALVGYRVALANLARAKGLYLDRIGLQFDVVSPAS